MSRKETTLEEQSLAKDSAPAIGIIQQSYLEHGSPEFIFETSESRRVDCRSLSRGNVCDIVYIDTSDCSENTPLHRAIRQTKMLNF